MKKQLASLAVLAIALSAGAAQAQSRGTISFELQGEAVRPAELTQGQPKPNSALGQAHHFGYNYNQCYNYYRWVYNSYYGWQRYYVGTRCY